VIVSETLLVAFADGELDPETTRRVERMVAEDVAARRKVEIYRETAMLLRAACHESLYASDDVATGEGLAARESVAVMRWRTVRRRAPRRHAWAAAASIAAAVIGFGGGALWTRQPTTEREDLVAEIANYHPIYARETRHLVEIPATSKDELVTWLGARLDRAPFAVPDLAAAGLSFAGGRLLAIDGRPVAQLMYTRANGRPIGVCLTRMDGPPAPLGIERRGALRLASWKDDSFAYVVVGELGDRAIRDIAARAAHQL
jgi:anti-sigma factor RsiW